MTTPEKSRVLATLLAAGRIDTYPAGTCVAWMDSADRVCAKPTETYLCPRHTKVAQRKFERELAKVTAQQERWRAKAERERPALEARLEKIEARLDAIDPFRTDPGRDTAVINTPLRTRLPSDRRITELAQLHQERDRLRRRLGVAT